MDTATACAVHTPSALTHHHCNIRDDVTVLAHQVRNVANRKGNVFGNCRLYVFLCGYNAISFKFIVYIFVNMCTNNENNATNRG